VVSSFYVETYSGGKVAVDMTLSAWLVLDGTIYPLSESAGNTIGISYRTFRLPPAIEERTGIHETDYPGLRALADVGLPDGPVRLGHGTQGFASCPPPR
jgi:hypothetical protein